MFAFDTDYDPVGPVADNLLAEVGLDAGSVRDALADDRARRCPDREAPADRSQPGNLTSFRREGGETAL